MTSELTHLWACDETIFRIRIPTQKKWTNEKRAYRQQTLAVFSAGMDSENEII